MILSVPPDLPLFTYIVLQCYLTLCSIVCRYVPCVVDHSDNQPCAGLFMLHQGIQRRLAITIMQEQSPEIDLIWKDVKELVVGRYQDMYFIFKSLSF